MAASKIVEITRGQEELDELLAKNAYVVVDHYIDGCGPCVQLARYFKVLVKEFAEYIEGGHLVFAKMNVEGSPENEEYGVSKELVGFPWVHFYNFDGTLRDGDMPIDKTIKDKIQMYLDADGVSVK